MFKWVATDAVSRFVILLSSSCLLTINGYCELILFGVLCDVNVIVEYIVIEVDGDWFKAGSSRFWCVGELIIRVSVGCDEEDSIDCAVRWYCWIWFLLGPVDLCDPDTCLYVVGVVIKQMIWYLREAVEGNGCCDCGCCLGKTSCRLVFCVKFEEACDLWLLSLKRG